jgi:hypothetical protein
MPQKKVAVNILQRKLPCRRKVRRPRFLQIQELKRMKWKKNANNREDAHLSQWRHKFL